MKSTTCIIPRNLHHHLGLVLLFFFCALTPGSLTNLIATAAPTAAPTSQNDITIIQHPLTMSGSRTPQPLPSEQEDGAGVSVRIPVPGHNGAFYGPIPKAEQIFDIDFLEIAPSPIPLNKYFFILLRGEISSSSSSLSSLDLAAAENATLSITVSAVLEENDEKLEPTAFTIPLKTAELAEGAHLAIRNAKGEYRDYLTLEGRNDILTDYWIPGPFVRTGRWRFEVVASLPVEGDDEKEGVCLFAVTLEQRLEGDGGW